MHLVIYQTERILNKNQKLDFIMNHQRKKKQRQRLIIAAILLIFGALMIYFQVMNFGEIV